MKFLCIGGRFPVNFLRDLGHEVLALGSARGNGHPQDIYLDFFQPPENAPLAVAEAFHRFHPDWIIQVDDSTPLIHLGLENLKVPKAWYAVDTHLHGPWHSHLAPLFDVVFCAQKNQIAVLQQYHTEVKWLPLCFTLNQEFLGWQERIHEISFVGTLDPKLNPARVALFDELQKQGVFINLCQGEVQPVYRNSRLVINQSVADDLNSRFFEAMGCGALLITDAISHSLHDIGEPGRDFLVYAAGDVRDLVEKIKWARANPHAAEEMARRGQQLILNSHTAARRIQTMLAAFTEPRPARVLQEPDVVAHLAWAHEYVSRLDIAESKAAFFASEAMRLAQSVEASVPGNAWCCIVLARLALEKGAYAEALACLDRILELPVHAELRKPFYFFRSLVLAHIGKRVEARLATKMGLNEFPSDPELIKLAEVLN